MAERPAPWWLDPVGFILGAAAAFSVAVAWIPFRRAQSSVEVALALVVTMALAGAGRRRAAVLGAAAASAVGFTYFDTQPFDHWSIARAPDLATAVSLVVVGAMTGELALRLARSRRNEAAATVQLSRVRDAAALLAHGEELVVVIGAVAAELAEAVGVADCWFSSEPLPAGTPVVGRDGLLEADAGRGEGGLVAVPVWALGQVVGNFLLHPVPGATLSPSRLQVAMTLADQVGAALAAQAPLPPLPPDGTRAGGPGPRLRVVPNGAAPARAGRASAGPRERLRA